MTPQVGERWVRKDCNRSLLGDHDGMTFTIGYRYISGIGGSGLWKRGLTPQQTIDGKDWVGLFKRPTTAIRPPR